MTLSKRFEEIRVIGGLLALMYVVSLAIYALHIPVPFFSLHAWILVIFLAGLFGASLGIFGRFELARQVLVIGNFVLGFYELYLTYVFPHIVSWYYGPACLFLGVYFLRKDVRQHFRSRSRSGKSVLVIDDDDILIRTVRHILTAHGYTVHAAHKGEDGLHMARYQQPDLILLDVILPGIKGREVCRRLKADQKTKHIPVIFLTAKDSQDDIEAEIGAGGEAHLTKPVNKESLVLTVQGVINR